MRLTRRELLRRTGTGLGLLGLGSLLAEVGSGAEPDPRNPLAPRAPHFPAKAKRFIHVYLNGGPSHLDTFDPKPLLERYAGQMLPAGNLTTERRTGAALPSPFRFRRYRRRGPQGSGLFQPDPGPPPENLP